MTGQTLERFLEGVALFKGLPTTERRQLVSVSREKAYAKGETVFRAGDLADAVCVVKTGRVHLMKFLERGQASTTCVMTTGETFCCLFCDRLRDVEQRSCMAYETVEQRLAQVLVTLSKKFGRTIPLTKHELAELASTTVETAIRVLSQLRKQGIITSSRGATTIAKPDQLQRLAGS